MHFVWYAIKVYAGIVVFVVSIVPYRDMPFPNVFFLIPCVVILIVAMPFRRYLGKFFGLHEIANITKEQRMSIKRSNTNHTLASQGGAAMKRSSTNQTLASRKESSKE